jgi:hypothetical protein
MADMRYRAGLTELVEYLKIADQDAVDLEAVARVAETAALLTPDSATEDLAAIDAFAADVLAQKPTAHLAVAGLDFTVDPRSPAIAQRFSSRAFRLVVLRASIASRRGDQQQALLLADGARHDCELCSSTLAMAALVRARMGDFPQALVILDRGRGAATEGPLVAAGAMIRDAAEHANNARTAAGVARAWETAESLASLELWGQAYATLSRAEIQPTPETALRYAELAFRAGYTDKARTILAQTPGASPDEALAEWAAAMGWQK